MPSRSNSSRSRAVLLVRNGVRHDARVLRAAGVLAEAGYTPTIIGSLTTATPARRDAIGGVEVLRLRSRSPVGAVRRLTGKALPAPLAAIHRTLTALDWNRRALARLLRIRPALIHANDHNTMWPALAARLLTGARVVYDSHELWPDRNGRREWRRWLVAAERLFVKHADVVITASPGYAGVLAARYGIAAPAVVRNIPAERGAYAPPDVSLGECAYVGGLMPGRGLEQAIAALERVPAASLRLVGGGPAGYVATLRELAQAAGVDGRVEFAGVVAPEQAVGAVADAGFGLCLIQPICLSYELTLPNKLFEYAAAGLPILGSDLPVIAATIRAGDIGCVVHPTDVDALAAAMTSLADPARNARLRGNVRRFAAGNTWEGERAALARAYAVAARERERP